MGRISGKLDGDSYVVTDPNGGILLQVPLSEVTPKLIATIARNKWPAIPETING